MGNEVHKGRELHFRIAACNVPEPYDVYWKVKNFGEEAARVNQLRGEIRKGSGTLVERTAYTGCHYVECYVVRSGGLCARNRHPVTVF